MSICSGWQWPSGRKPEGERHWLWTLSVLHGLNAEVKGQQCGWKRNRMTGIWKGQLARQLSVPGHI